MIIPSHIPIREKHAMSDLPTMMMTRIEGSFPHWPHGTHYRVSLFHGLMRMSTTIHRQPEDPKPSLHDILHQLFVEADDGTMTFAEYCQDTGCDSDSRAAETTWKELASTNVRLHKLLGNHYDEIKAKTMGYFHG